MPKTYSPTDEEIEVERIRDLFRAALRMTEDEAAVLRKKIQKYPEDLDSRYMLYTYSGSKTIYTHTEELVQEAFEQACWFIDRAKTNTFCLMDFSRRLCSYSKVHIETLENKWLVQTEKHPNHAQICGNAGSFIIWNNFEKGEELLLKAARLDPGYGHWPSILSIHYNGQFFKKEGEWKKYFAERTIETALRAYPLEHSTGFMNLEYAAECALYLEDLDTAEFCGKEMLESAFHPSFDHIGNSILGLVAIRRNETKKAVNYLLKRGKKLFEPSRFSWQLVTELFNQGERESLVKYIESFERKVRRKYREKWIKQIKEGICPDFKK